MLNTLKNGLLTLVVFLLFLLPLRAQEAVLNTINLGQTNGSDLQAKFGYFQQAQNSKGFDVGNASLEQAHSWLNSLIPSNQTSATGSQFLAAAKLYNGSQTSQWYVYPTYSIAETIRLYHYRASVTETSISGFKHINNIDFHYGGSINLEPGETSLLVLAFDNQFAFPPCN